MAVGSGGAAAYYCSGLLLVTIFFLLYMSANYYEFLQVIAKMEWLVYTIVEQHIKR
jgi:hypothetical protein